MSGWVRLGVVFSVLWVCAVAGFAAFEWKRFPVQASYGIPNHFHREAAQKFYLIRLREGMDYETLFPHERARFLKLFEDAIRNETTEEGRQQRIAARDALSYGPALNWTALIALVSIPIALGWILTALLMATIKWVASGFKEKQ